MGMAMTTLLHFSRREGQRASFTSEEEKRYGDGHDQSSTSQEEKGRGHCHLPTWQKP